MVAINSRAVIMLGGVMNFNCQHFYDILEVNNTMNYSYYLCINLLV